MASHGKFCAQHAQQPTTTTKKTVSKAKTAVKAKTSVVKTKAIKEVVKEVVESDVEKIKRIKAVAQKYVQSYADGNISSGKPWDILIASKKKAVQSVGLAIKKKFGHFSLTSTLNDPVDRKELQMMLAYGMLTNTSPALATKSKKSL
jgi:hypothetical protein